MSSSTSTVTASNARVLAQAPLDPSAKSTPAASTTSTITSAKDSSSAEQSKKPAPSGFKAFWESIADFLWKCITCGFFKKKEEETKKDDAIATNQTSKKSEDIKTMTQKAELKYSAEAKAFRAYCKKTVESDEFKEIRVTLANADRINKAILEIIKKCPDCATNPEKLIFEIGISPEIPASFKVQLQERLGKESLSTIMEKFENAAALSQVIDQHEPCVLFFKYLEESTITPSLALGAFETLADKDIAVVLAIYQSEVMNSKKTREDFVDFVAHLYSKEVINSFGEMAGRYMRDNLIGKNR